MNNTNENKPKKNVTWIVITAIIVALAVGLLGYMLFQKFKPTPQNIGINDWYAQLAQSIKDPNQYVNNIDVQTYEGKIVYSLIKAGEEFKYSVNVGRDLVDLTKDTPSSFKQAAGLPLDKTFTLFEALNKAGSHLEQSNLVLPVITSTKKSTQTPLLYIILESTLPLIVFILIGWFLMRPLFRGTGGMMGVIGEEKNPATKIKSDKKFSDIAGNKEAIEEISEIVDYLKNPKKYATAGARMPHGILLGGPPGTGKTLLAKATAGEANVPFYFISASNFVEMYVGLGAKRVRSVVAEARKNAPAIIFIDELDAIGRTRGAGLGGGHDEREQTLNQLLVEMDGMKENNGLLFFAATNRTDVLDPALIRPGRFDRQITVGLPDVKEREEILELHAKGKRISPNVKMSNVAKRTPGYSGAQLENVINEASLLAVRFDHQVITLEDIDEAIDRVMAGPAKKNRVISKEELTMVAYHEAGHAVVGIKVPGGNKVQKITIIPRGQAGGYNLMTPEDEKYNMSRNELISMITSFMGGRAAEEIIYGADNISTGASDDIQKATKIARKMVAEWGMSDLGPIQYEADEGSPFLGRDYLKSSTFSPEIAKEIDLEVRKIVLDAKNRAVKVISKNKELLELIKTALLEKETIVAEEIEYIAKNMKLPPVQQKDELNIENLSIDDVLKEANSTEEITQ
ncbi:MULTISPECIES: ATP-dependent zinc metalloprotease FtsH [unclassified Mycoplasma]|uniref:ATP-dependent zinc metalloprotease FtsH n=1 Tax=unclassified Mycoplasma TaxID=2683645 RepID=UPI00216AB54D|nr:MULTISPECIES: ATP-dependent zinc metalloprotease FtsH [unclassified Mycoplasma]MCS4536610.1 ATP-dependent zinc metalloprotease FtsH [Mycoplasma sp. CSL7475-4]MCT4469570.1 ATP-dependent zinc metalloprotease FtsH [Mycoplasma sp. HS2188]